MTDAEELDVRGRTCPMPILLLTRKMAQLQAGAILRVLADDREFPSDVRSWCQHSGNVLLGVETEGDHYVARVERALRRSEP